MLTEAPRPNVKLGLSSSEAVLAVLGPSPISAGALYDIPCRLAQIDRPASNSATALSQQSPFRFMLSIIPNARLCFWDLAAVYVLARSVWTKPSIATLRPC